MNNIYFVKIKKSTSWIVYLLLVIICIFSIFGLFLKDIGNAFKPICFALLVSFYSLKECLFLTICNFNIKHMIIFFIFLSLTIVCFFILPFLMFIPIGLYVIISKLITSGIHVFYSFNGENFSIESIIGAKEGNMNFALQINSDNLESSKFLLSDCIEITVNFSRGHNQYSYSNRIVKYINGKIDDQTKFYDQQVPKNFKFSKHLEGIIMTAIKWNRENYNTKTVINI